LLSSVTEFPIPGGTHGAPYGITPGANGGLWFTESSADKIGTMNAATGAVTQYTIPLANAQPFQIAIGPNNNVWFTEAGADAIGMLNIKTLTFTQYPLPTPNAAPYGITPGPNNTVWFTEWDANRIGMVDIATGKVSEFPLPTLDAVPEGITMGPGGSIWFTESLGNQIGTINTTTDKITEMPLPTPNAEPAGIVLGPGGNLWFTEYTANQIGVFNPTSGAFSAFPIAASKTEPDWIIAGPDGNIWFTQSATSQVGMLNPATGTTSEFTPPSAQSGPRAIAAGPDGQIWFAELDAGKIGVVAPDTHFVVTINSGAGLTAGGAFGLTVTVEYASGAVDTGCDQGVSLTLANGPAGAALSGSATVMPVNGIASFSGLSVNSGGGYTFQISSSSTPAFLAGPYNVQNGGNPGGIAGDAVSNPIPPLAIVGEHPVFAGRGKHRHVVGFQLVFNNAVDASIAQNSTNYTLTQNVKHGRQKAVQAIRLRAVYDASTDAVDLLLVGRPKFTTGGQLAVKMPPAIGGLGSGLAIYFNVLAGGRGIQPA
jgi:virginiamycin B lyase